jgi:hypothetical protein
MLYVMTLFLGLAWFDGTHTASVWAVYRAELRRIDAQTEELMRTLPPRVRERLFPMRLPPPPMKK